MYDPRYLRWVLEMNAEEYFEAHEFLENLWIEEEGEIRPYWQGLIQVAVALHHLGHANPVGGVKVWRTARKHLAPFPDRCKGLDLAHLRTTMDRNLAPYDAVPFDALRERTVDWAAVERPRIALAPEPTPAEWDSARAFEIG